MTSIQTGHAPIDICVPVYNAAAFVAETLDSILAQEFTDFRLLISVDQSGDESARICRRYDADERVRVYQHDRRLGYVGNSNFLMQTARAPFMKFALHDDLLASDEIGLLYQFMEQEPACAVAIPSIIGFGESAANFDQHEVRGPVLRRLLDIIMNQQSVAAFHGLVRINPSAALRPMLPGGYLRDFEVDVYWMARAAASGELRRVESAIERKRFLRGMISNDWCPRNATEASHLLVHHTARLAELAFTVCRDDADRMQVFMAALVRLRGEGLNYGVPKLTRTRLRFKPGIKRAFFRSLTGPAADFAIRTDVPKLLRDMKNDLGVVGASRLARQLQAAASRGKLQRAETLYHQALEMDPLAGWAAPFRKQLNTAAELRHNAVRSRA